MFKMIVLQWPADISRCRQSGSFVPSLSFPRCQLPTGVSGARWNSLQTTKLPSACRGYQWLFSRECPREPLPQGSQWPARSSGLSGWWGADTVDVSHGSANQMQTPISIKTTFLRFSPCLSPCPCGALRDLAWRQMAISSAMGLIPTSRMVSSTRSFFHSRSAGV